MYEIKILAFGVVALFLLAGNTWCASNLQYDGVYMSDVFKAEKGNISYRMYIRFYPDGDVIKVSSTGSPEEIRRWFSKESPNVSRGKISTIEGNRISFSVAEDKGSVDYSGQIEGDTIIMSIYSHINKSQSSGVIYLFVKW